MKKHDYKIYGNEKELLTYFPYRDEANLDSPNYPIHIESVGITKPDPNYHVSRNRWNIFTVEYVVSGEGYLKYNGKNYKVKAGDVYIMSPDSVQRYGSDPENPYEKIWINFRSGIFGEILKSFQLDEPVYHCRNSLQYLKSIYRLKDTRHFVEDSSFVCFQLLLELISNIKENEMSLSREYPDFMEKALEYIDKKTPEPISIEELTHYANVSAGCLINAFKKYIGETPYSYQLKTRLKLSKMYLTNTDKGLDEIAYICRFYDAFALSRSFKKYFKLSPKEYRDSLVKPNEADSAEEE